MPKCSGREARHKSDFALFAPHLEEVVALVRDKAALLGQALNLRRTTLWWTSSPPGITTQDIDTLFKALSRRLPSLINETIELQQNKQPVLPLTGKFPPSKQRRWRSTS